MNLLLYAALVVIDPAKHSHRFMVLFELVVSYLVMMTVGEEAFAVELKLEMDFLALPLKLDKEIRESRSNADDSLDPQFLVTRDNHSQKLLLAFGLSPEERNSVGVQLVTKRVISNNGEVIASNRNDGLVVPQPLLEKIADRRDTDLVARLFAVRYPFDHPSFGRLVIGHTSFTGNLPVPHLMSAFKEPSNEAEGPLSSIAGRVGETDPPVTRLDLRKTMRDIVGTHSSSPDKIGQCLECIEAMLDDEVFRRGWGVLVLAWLHDVEGYAKAGVGQLGWLVRVV